MSGHSKWATTKHKKAIIDSRRAKNFAKLIKAIEVSARSGGADISGNPTLFDAIAKAKKNSVPADNIDRAVKRGAGLETGGKEWETIMYEGYAAGGVALLIECLSDNRNRAASEVRVAVTRNGGNMADPGSVSYLFNAGPFSHTGVKLDYAASEDLSFLLAVTNAHAISSADANESGATQFGAQVGYKGQYLNFIYGAVTETSATDAIFVDYTGGFDLSDSFYVGINAAYAYSDEEDAGYQGAALYLENTFSETFALGLRPEFFSLISGDESEDLFALTLTGSTQLDDNLKLVTELRYDSSDDLVIEGIAAEKNVTALTIAAVYSF